MVPLASFQPGMTTLRQQPQHFTSLSWRRSTAVEADLNASPFDIDDRSQFHMDKIAVLTATQTDQWEHRLDACVRAARSKFTRGQ
jgi:hypothetical protein